MKIKYNQNTNEITVDLGDTLEFETNIHEFEDETVLAITMQHNRNSLVAQLKRGLNDNIEDQDEPVSLMAFLKENHEDKS